MPLAATGSFRFVPKSIGIDTIQEVVFEPGVSENDIIKKISPPYQIENKFVGDFSAVEIYKLLKILRKQDIVKPISESNGETRFGFCDPRVHDFVFDWNILLDTILTNMQDKWILLNKKTTTPEKTWYLSIFTKHESNDFFTSVALKKLQHYKTLADFCKKHIRNYKMRL